MFGIYVLTDGNTVQGNRIGLAASGAAAIGNQYGIFVGNGKNSTIGGTAAGTGNTISGTSPRVSTSREHHPPGSPFSATQFMQTEASASIWPTTASH